MPQPGWIPLKLLSQRFNTNIAALASRDPALAAQLLAWIPSTTYHIRNNHDHILLGAGEPGAIQPLPQRMSPGAAHATQLKLFPTSRSFPHGNYSEPVLVAGEDLGWFLNGLYAMPCHVPIAPGHREPLFFLMRDLERFWVILHIQEWSKLLADQRVRLYAGEDCLDQFRRSLIEQVMCRWPTLSVAIDPTIWPEGITLESCYIEGRRKQNAELARLQQQLERMNINRSPAHLAELFASGRPLRVLGITSRYTTFIQYSLRDWLEAFGRLGHETRVLIESADHELPNNLAVASACADFDPDLVVAIDHHRSELSGVPPQVPVVMWVQDRLSNIYNADAGQQQTRLDFTIGYSMLELTQTCGYPPSRFMPTMMAVNEKRFTPRKMTTTEAGQFGCEVSFVTNCTVPAELILREASETLGSPMATRLVDEVYQRLSAIYEAGESITSGYHLRSLIVQTTIEQQVSTDIDRVLDIFMQRINNALFRHQAIRWVAELGVDLHLYGKGWEANPEFSKYARGIANNQSQLPLIYQASAINLQVTPFGAVHQRLLDGLSAGGFFLLRSTVSDEMELILREMDHWCQDRDIHSGAEMVARQDADLQALTRRYTALSGDDPLAKPNYYFGAIGECSLSGYTRTANTLWNNSDRVTFNTREQLQAQVKHFLANPEERREIAESMRQRVLQTHTYESITRKMLRFIGNNMQEFRQAAVARAA